MSDPTFTDPPETPSRGSAGFSGQVASFLAWLSTFVAQLVIAVAWMRGRVDEVSGNASQVATDASLAQTARQGAEQARDSAAGSVAGAGAPAWVSGTTYAIGNVRYSPVTFKTYRRRTAGAGTVDPSADKANWSDLTVPVSGDGVLDTLSMKYATLNGTALTSGHFAEFQEQGKRALRNILGTAAATYDFTDYLALDGAQAAFTDTAGTTALTAPGTSLGRMNDATDNAVNAVQANAGQRPLFGAAPREVRNLLQRTEEFDASYWIKGEASVIPNAGTAPDGKVTADKIVPSVANTNSHRVYVDVSQVVSVSTFSVYLKAAGFNFARITGGTGESVTIDLTDGSITNVASSPISFFSEEVGDGWYRVSTTKIALSGNNRLQVTLYATEDQASFAGDGASGVLVWGAQREYGALATPYQRVGAATDITETSVPSYGFARFDNSDDALATALPDGHTGDLIIFGRKGTWKEPNTVASAGTFTLGGTIAGTPATPGILRATGDLVGYLLAGKTLTNEETRRLTQYYASMGAKGLLVPGPELVANGGPFSVTAGWVANVNGNLSTVADWLRLTSTASPSFASFEFPTIIGRPYQASGDFRSSAGSWRLALGNSAGSLDLLSSATSGSGSLAGNVFIATSARTYFSIRNAATTAGDYAEINNITVKPLNLEEAF